jgi:hypothetical protein
MKHHRKKVITFFAVCMFAMLMMLNVNTTINGTNFSVVGYTALVSGSDGKSEVSCKCALFNGNDKCRSNNWGSTCATGTQDCSNGDNNCL